MVKQHVGGNDVIQMADDTVFKSDSKVGLKAVLVSKTWPSPTNPDGYGTRQKDQRDPMPSYSGSSITRLNKSIY